MLESKSGSTATAGRAAVVLSVPADSVYLSVVRTAAAGLGARLDFTLDDIEDLRIAVDEACALLLEQARADSAVRVSFSFGVDRLRVRATVTCNSPRLPSREGFSWTVLAALTTTLEMEVEESDLVITIERARAGGDG